MPNPSLLPLLALRAEEPAPPVIDIDGTVLVQFVLFVILYFVLRNLLFLPYLEMRRKRTAGIDGARAEAAHMEEMALATVKDYEARMAAARGRAEEERLRGRGAGQERERELLADARSAVSARIQAARKQIEADVQAAKVRLQQEAGPLGHRIASKILGREV